MERLNSIMSQQKWSLGKTDMKIESSRIIERMAEEDPQGKITSLYSKSSKKHS